MRGRPAFYAVLFCILPGITLLSQTAAAQGSHFWTPKVPPRAHYTIGCRIDSATGRLTGTETVRFTNESARPMSRLALDWSLNGRQTLEITVNGTVVPVIRDTAEGAMVPPLLFDLPRALAKGKQAEITMKFSLSLPSAGSEEKITLTAWFPKLWWGMSTHDAYDVRVDAPAAYTLGTSGRWDSKTHSYHAENVGTFGLFLGKRMHVLQANAGDVLVRCLYSDRGEPCANLVLKTAVDVINFYRERFGFYPYKSLDIVPGYDRPWGGYNAATSLSVIHGEEAMSEKPLIHWQWITAHEIGHMYWGEYILDNDTPGWLWIGMGIYADREYIRARGLSLKKHRDLMAIYQQGVREHVNTTVAITAEQWESVDFDFNNIVTHGKGFSIISALGNYLGKKTFDRIYLQCLKQYGGGRMGAAELQAVCEAESGENLGWFFDAWMRSSQYLAYKVSSQQCLKREQAYVSTVTVERAGSMKFPVPVVAYFEDGTSQRKKTERLSDTNTLEYTSGAPLKYVTIDPDSELAMVVPPPQMTAEELAKGVDRLPWSDAGREALLLFTRAQELKPSDEQVWFKLGMTLYDGEYYAEALQAFGKSAELSKDSTSTKYAAYVWQGQLLDILGRRQEALQKYQLALAKDTGQEQRHSQYNMVINRKWVEERLEKPFVRR